ncbi:MAG: SsrA-binding protein SmpB [Bacteroidia bacterium]
MTIISSINIKNRRASFDYFFLDKYLAGIQLTGTEIKSIREGKININDAFCSYINNELWLVNAHIAEYTEEKHFNHAPKRNRKLLLQKQELKKIFLKLKDAGLTIIPIRFFINEKGFAKVEIALAKGKKNFDKRDSIKKKDVEREISRKIK